VAKVRSRLLVIDASIARSSGDTSQHPTAQLCCEFLQAVLTLCHRMALTPPIREEWNKHQSRFASRWRTSMMARKKIEIVKVASEHSLANRLTRTGRNEYVAAILEKDRRLIEAALATDQRVASLDDQVRKHLQATVAKLPEVAAVCWVNPAKSEEQCIAWLKSGAPAERPRMLGHARS
jgi:hypothetical protein